MSSEESQQKRGRPTKEFECPCGESDPSNFYDTYKSLCKECKSKRTLGNYVKKERESSPELPMIDFNIPPTPPDSPKKESKIDISGFKSNIIGVDMLSIDCINSITKNIEDITPMLKKIIEKDNIDSNQKINIMFNQFILPYIKEKIRYRYMLHKIQDNFRENNFKDF